MKKIPERWWQAVALICNLSIKTEQVGYQNQKPIDSNYIKTEYPHKPPNTSR